MTEVHKSHEDNGKAKCKSAIKSYSNRIKSLATTVDARRVQKKLASVLLSSISFCHLEIPYQARWSFFPDPTGIFCFYILMFKEEEK